MPPRRPRVLTLRLALVALLLGVVGAVASVPVAAVVVTHTLTRGPLDSTAWRFEAAGDDGQTHQVYLIWYRYAYGAAACWESGSEPDTAQPRFARWLDRPGIRSVERMRRPREVRTELDGVLRMQESYRVGWPFHPVRSVRRYAEFAMGEMTQAGMWDFTVRGRQYTIPYLPHWPGLLGNIAFYTLLVLTPIVLWRWLRLRRRTRRNQCLACGYDAGAGVAVCPECGLALSTNPSRARGGTATP